MWQAQTQGRIQNDELYWLRRQSHWSARVAWGIHLGPGVERIYTYIPPFECAVLCPRKASPIKLLPQKKQFKVVSMEDIASTTNFTKRCLGPSFLCSGMCALVPSIWSLDVERVQRSFLVTTSLFLPNSNFQIKFVGMRPARN